MSMEVVNAFNRELKSLLSCKLPVSRQKMSMITKAAIKALKFYKHVVQSVEKFVNKCSPDYKVPALYVIDAIVRQSRHQFCEKDVFGPRFMRNIIPTFLSLLQADPKDHHLILRVLNLWQQNEVFPSHIVDYLIKLVSNPMDRALIDEANHEITKLLGPAKAPQPHHNDSGHCPENDAMKTNSQEGGLINSVSQLLAKFHSSGQDASDQIKQLQNLQEKFVEQSQLLAQGQMMDCNVLTELHALMEELTRRAAQAAKEQQLRRQQEAEVKQVMQKRIIDFDYGDDSSEDDCHQEENNKPTDSNDNEDEFVIDLDLVAQLEQMTETLAQTLALQEELRKAREQGMRLSDDRSYINIEESENSQANADSSFRNYDPDTKDTDDKMKVFDYNHSHSKERQSEQESSSRGLEDGEIDQDYRNRQQSRGSSSDRGSSGSPYSRKRRKSSRSRSRSSDSRSGSRRRRKRHHSRRKNRDRDRERRKKGLPAIKDRRVIISSRTVFVGHLMKTVTEAKLLTTMEELGAVDDFKVIPPRGCAFVTYSARKSACKAIQHLNGTRLDGKDIKVAWAPNRGIKDSNEFRQYWDEVEGCAYIPFIRFPSTDFAKVKELLDGGGELDEDSVPENIQMELEAAMQKHEKDQKRALEEPSEAIASTGSSHLPASIAAGLPALPPLPPTIGGVPPPMPFLPPPPMLMAAAMQSMRPDLMKLVSSASVNNVNSTAEKLSSPVDGVVEGELAASLSVSTVTSSATPGPAMSIRPQAPNALSPFPPVVGGFGFPSGPPRGLMPPAPPPFGLPPFGPGIIPPPFLPRKS